MHGLANGGLITNHQGSGWGGRGLVIMLCYDSVDVGVGVFRFI